MVGVFFSSPAETQPDYSGPRSFPIHGCGGGDFHVQHSVWSLFKSCTCTTSVAWFCASSSEPLFELSSVLPNSDAPLDGSTVRSRVRLLLFLEQTYLTTFFFTCADRDVHSRLQSCPPTKMICTQCSFFLRRIFLAPRITLRYTTTHPHNLIK